MNDADKDKEIARGLAAYLTTHDRYSTKSPLDEMMQAQITQLTRQIAAEVIAATPELHDHIRKMVQDVVRSALARDGWLNTTVITAVSKALTDLALERKRADDDES